MERQAGGVFYAEIAARAGDKYAYKLDDQKPLPDPVSRLLPEGVRQGREVAPQLCVRGGQLRLRHRGTGGERSLLVERTYVRRTPRTTWSITSTSSIRFSSTA